MSVDTLIMMIRGASLFTSEKPYSIEKISGEDDFYVYPYLGQRIAANDTRLYVEFTKHSVVMTLESLVDDTTSYWWETDVVTHRDDRSPYIQYSFREAHYLSQVNETFIRDRILAALPLVKISENDPWEAEEF